MNRVAGLIAPHITEAYPTRDDETFIFLYNPEEDMLYVAPSEKFHIDLINYVLGQRKHTDPNDSYQLTQKYVLGTWYRSDDTPHFHA